MIGTHRRLPLTHLQVGQRNHPKRNLQKILDITRIYVADVQKGLVREEWCLYPDAFKQRLQTWRAQARTCTLLTGGGRLEIDIPIAAQIPVDIDTAAMTFRHASLALLATGLIRWRDCLTTLAVVVLAFCVSFALAWWQRVPISEPLQHVAALVTTTASPVRYNASVELATLALLAADHDAALWHTHGASKLEFKPNEGTLVLHTATTDLLSTPIGPLPEAPPVIELKPYTVEAFQSKLTSHLESMPLTLKFGDPYPVAGSVQWEQHITVSIADSDDTHRASVASVLVDLSEHLFRLPITLHHARCMIEEGVINTCELSLAMRGLGT